MGDGLPAGFFHQRDQRDGDVGELENGEGEQVTDLLRRGGMDVVPFGKGSKHAEDEHEQHEVKQTEDDKAEVIMVPADITPNIASNAIVPLKPMEIIVSSMAGALVMSMS